MNAAADTSSHLELVHEVFAYEIGMLGTIIVVAAGWRCNHTRRKDPGRPDATQSAAQLEGGALG